MLNGTIPVLDISEDFGCQVTYSYKNEVNETLGGGEYVNAQWYHPRTVIDFSLAWFSQDVFNTLKTFFVDRQGSFESFCFLDPIDNSSTIQSGFDTELGIKTFGIVIVKDGRYQMVKRYLIETSLGNYHIDRPITRPKEGSITFYTNGGSPATATVDYDTGEVLTGGAAATRWTGQFYTLMRIENDIMPFKFLVKDFDQGIVLYNLPTLKLIEVKENDIFYAQLLAQAYDHHWQIDLPVDYEINEKSFTDIYTSESGYESRDNYRNNVTEIVLPSQNLNFDTTGRTIEYVVGLWRVCLGTFAHIFVTDTDTGTDDEFRFTEDISFTTVSQYETPYGSPRIVEVGNISFREDNYALKSNYCLCWRVTRTDATVIGVTNHDRIISFEGVDYYPNTGFNATSPVRTAELNADSSELVSVFDVYITEEDLLNDKYKNAQVDIFIYDWINLVNFSYIYQGNITSYSVGFLLDKAKNYQLDLASQASKLDVKRSVKTSSSCRVRFLSQGENQCNRTIDGSVRETVTVTGTNASGDILNISPSVATSFAYGTAKFTTGVNANTTIYITAIVFGGAELQLLYPPPFTPSVGDSVELTKGCGKQPQDCQGFGNIANFRGEPRLPNIDNIANTAEI